MVPAGLRLCCSKIPWGRRVLAPKHRPSVGFGVEQTTVVPTLAPGGQLKLVPASGAAFSTDGVCSFWSQGTIFAQLPATVVTSTSARCSVPLPPSMHECGDLVYATFTSSSAGTACSSVGNSTPTVSDVNSGETTWTNGDGSTHPAAVAFRYACSDEQVGCDTIPHVQGASPTAGVDPGEVVVLTSGIGNTFSANHASCIWWHHGAVYVHVHVCEPCGCSHCSRSAWCGPPCGGYAGRSRQLQKAAHTTR